MRTLTFAGYLRSYVPYLAGTRSLSMSRLAGLTLGSPRVAEPLLLLAAVTDRTDELARCLKSRPKLLQELKLLDSLARDGALETALQEEDPRLRPEFTKAWRSYVTRRDAPLRDEHLKRLARERALELEATKSVTRYRVAKDLGLNVGNLHAFLTQGTVSKMSLANAYRLVDYLKAAA